MRRREGLWLVGFLMLASFHSEAQTFVETALLFSRTHPGGSARIQSLGGAQIGLGGDFSSALSNPAGLGMYNRSEFTISPAVNFAKISSALFEQSENDSKTTFHIPGFSLVFHNDYNKLVGFLGGTFSIGYTRVNDFNGNFKYAADALDTSIIDYFLEQADGFPISQFDSNGALSNTPTQLGYENYLIGDSSSVFGGSPIRYFTDVVSKPDLIEEIQTKGAQNQWSFSYGVNYSDRLFLGAGIGITTLRYKSRKQYKEFFRSGPVFDMFLEESLEIQGSGVNASFGAIFRPIDKVQIGLSATTPTYYELSDTYSAIMQTSWDSFDYLGDGSLILSNEQYTSDLITSDYSLRTPGKINIGATFFVSKRGFITADVERVNYAKSKYNSITQGLSFNAENEDIRSLYQSVFNIRSGLEYRLNAFRFRTGYAYMPEPFKATQNNVSTSVQRITGGIGYRGKKFYVDMAVVHAFGENSYRPYTVNSVSTPLVTSKQKSTNVIVTVGLPF